MANPIAPKRSNVGAAEPAVGALVEGELAINTADGFLFVRVGANVVKVGSVGVRPGEPAAVNAAVGLQFNTSALKTVLDAYTGAYEWSLPAHTGEVTVVDGAATLRWGAAVPKGVLRLPISSLSIGEGTSANLNAGSLTGSRNYSLPNKSGTFALMDDVPATTLGAIEGFEIYTTATTIVVGPGVAEVNGVMMTSAGATISTSRSANTTYNVYLEGNGSLNRVTTGFSAPYAAYARTRSGAPNSRWLFSVRTNDGTTSTNYPRLRATGGAIVETRFTQNTGLAPLGLLANASIPTTIDQSFVTLAPAGPTRDVIVRLGYGGTGGVSRIWVYQGAPGGTGGTFDVLTNVMAAGGVNTVDAPVDGTPKIRVDGGSVILNTLGYRYVR